MNFNHNLTESDNDNIDVKSQLEHQFQIQETKESGWIFDKINSMKIRFYKNGELKGTNYVKIALRSNAILNRQDTDKKCFLWSILAYLRPCENRHPSRVTICIQYFNELSIGGLDFSNGFKCSDMHRFEKLNSLSIKIFELIFHQDENKWKHNLVLIEVIKKDSDRVVDLLLYKNQYALIKKFNVFLGDRHKNSICRRCFNSYTSENMLMLHKPKCELNDISTIRTSPEPHLHWKDHFHENPITFRIYADFEADNEKDNSSVCNKTTNFYKQNPVLNGYHIISGMEEILKSG